ncbi:MAG: T9SS type A sorting domain-containing protein [Bacteroidetes bacterium]|nr:T9SS type A sorting domain-containing protein [Bacteroidota bacterium]
MGDFNLSFDGNEKGAYVITITDLLGKTIFSKKIEVENTLQVEKIQLPQGIAKGIYIVSAVNTTTKKSYTEELIVQ